MSSSACIVGIGASAFGLSLPQSQSALAATAFREAISDAGLAKQAVDGISIHYGGPLGVDYDRLASMLGLEVRYVNQSWLNGRFISTALINAALAVSAGLANVVACVTAVSFTRVRHMLGTGLTEESMREEGGTHGEAPAYGLTSPAGGAALGLQRYRHRFGLTDEQLAQVVIASRAHAGLNPAAIRRNPATLDSYLASRMIADPLRAIDCCPVSDGAVVVLVANEAYARDLRKPAIRIAGMQGLRAGREEFVFAPRGLGVMQQTEALASSARPEDLEIFARAGVDRNDVQGFFTYDAFSPLVLYALERFGYCEPGQAGGFVADGRIGPGGALPVNTSGGLLSEAHVGGWNSVAEMVRQLRGEAGPRQIPNASVLQWGTAWGDSVILSNVEAANVG